MFASAGVFHHAGIKIPFFAFFGHDSRFVDSTQEPPLNMLAAMTLAAALCILIGCFPGALYALLPRPMDHDPFEAGHVLTQLQLLAFSALAFTWLKLSGIYPPELRSVHLDADWLYRRILPDALQQLTERAAPIKCKLRARAAWLTKRVVAVLTYGFGPGGLFTRPWPTNGIENVGVRSTPQPTRAAFDEMKTVWDAVSPPAAQYAPDEARRAVRG